MIKNLQIVKWFIKNSLSNGRTKIKIILSRCKGNKRIEIIHAAYQKLRENDNEIRNNLKLMDIKLADLIMPIKNMK